MGIGFVILLPFIFWVFIVMLIIAVSKSGSRNRRPVQRQSAGRTATQRYMPAGRKTAGRVTSERPKMQEGLFDMSLDNGKRSQKGFSLSDLMGKTGFDRYEARGRKKDFVSGYDKTINVKKAKHMQFSHTYDGHEPWDKCLPKEKDPWDKDFYA